MDLLPVGQNPRGGCPPSREISNDHFSGMGYPMIRSTFVNYRAAVEEYRRI